MQTNTVSFYSALSHAPALCRAAAILGALVLAPAMAFSQTAARQVMAQQRVQQNAAPLELTLKQAVQIALRQKSFGANCAAESCGKSPAEWHRIVATSAASGIQPVGSGRPRKCSGQHRSEHSGSSQGRRPVSSLSNRRLFFRTHF